MKEKTVLDSLAQISQLMNIDHANPVGNIHGGEIMKLMDNVAGIAAVRHSRCNVVTARVDKLVFLRPIYVGNLVTCTAKLIFVGKSSMEVAVTVEVEDLLQEQGPQRALSGYFTMVAVDKQGRPSEVPRLSTKTAEEKNAFLEGQKRYDKYKNKIIDRQKSGNL